MHQEVENIIDRLIGAVKSDKPFYTLKDFLSAGFPSFIVERIRIEINEKLKEEFELKKTEWANVEDSMVQEAWKDFQQTLFANSRMPKDKFYAITSRVVTEIVKVYLEPRQHMADYIYKGDDELNYEELVQRTDKLTIYKHFGRAIPLYMEKRKLKTLEKKRCKLLIHNLDANLVASYTAKDWAKVLELLFTLFGGRVDAKLIQLFFEDKGLYLTAKAFNELEEEISKERFIEILSYPDLLDIKLQEKFREQFREELIAQKNRFDQPDEEDFEVIDEKEQRLMDSFFGDYKADDPQMTDEESFNELFRTEQTDKSIFQEFEEAPDAEEISKSLKEGEQTDDIKAFRHNLVSVLDQAAHSFKSLSKEEKEESVDKKDEQANKIKSKKKESAEETNPSAKEEEDIGDDTDDPGALISDEADDPQMTDEEDKGGEEPMWQQYLRPDQMDVLMGKKGEEEKEIMVDEEILADDLIEETDSGNEQENQEEVENLEEFLADKEDHFIHELFKSSEKKYQKELKKIEGFENWEEAADYIQDRVFSANKIDMFSETAVEFTDRLQSYFNEYKS